MPPSEAPGGLLSDDQSRLGKTWGEAYRSMGDDLVFEVSHKCSRSYLYQSIRRNALASRRRRFRTQPSRDRTDRSLSMAE